MKALDQFPKSLDEALTVVARMESYSPKAPAAGESSVTAQDPGPVQEVKTVTGNQDEKLQKLRTELASHRRHIAQLQADNDFWRGCAGNPAVPPVAPPLMSQTPTPPSTAGLVGGPRSTPLPYQATSGAPPTGWPYQPAADTGQPYAPPGWPPGAAATAAGNWTPQPAETTMNYPYAPPSDGPAQMSTSSPAYGPVRGRGRGRGVRNRGRNRVDYDQCRRCFQYGHWASDCSQSPSGVHEIADSAHKSYTHFKAVLHGRKICILIDTGASVNLLPHRLAEDLKLEPCTTALSAANGTKIHVLGAVTAEFYTAGTWLKAHFVVTDAVSTPILGYTWLRENECAWQFNGHSFSVRVKSIPLTCQSDECMLVRRVLIKEAAFVPVDHIARVPVELPANSLQTPSGDWLVTAKEIRPGLLMSSALLSDGDEFPAVQLFNMMGKKQFLRAGLV